MQLFNQINARKINDELNVFSGIIHSHLFIYIWIVEAGLQVRKATFPFTMTPSQAMIAPCKADASVHVHSSMPSLSAWGCKLLAALSETDWADTGWVTAQVIIMCVPQIGQFFKVRPQSWQEWLFALAVGAGSIVVALAVKLLSKCAAAEYLLHIMTAALSYNIAAVELREVLVSLQ